MSFSKFYFDIGKLLRGTKEILAVAVIGVPICYNYDSCMLSFGNDFNQSEISSEGLLALKHSLHRSLDHVVLSVGNRAYETFDIVPASILALKKSNNWLRITPHSDEFISILNYWNEKLLRPCSPDKVLLYADKFNLIEWSEKSEIDKQWASAIELFFYNNAEFYDSGVHLQSKVEDVRSRLAFLFEYKVYTKLTAVFSKGISFYFQIDVSNDLPGVAYVDSGAESYLENKKYELTLRLGNFVTELCNIYGPDSSVEFLYKEEMDALFDGIKSF